MTLEIATAIAGKTAEQLTAGAKALVVTITRKLRERFRGRPSDEAILVAAEQTGQPDALAGVLTTLAAADPAFWAELQSLWSQARADNGGVVNTFSGKADKVIQARDVGSITIN